MAGAPIVSRARKLGGVGVDGRVVGKGDIGMKTNGHSENLQQEMRDVRRNLGQHTEQVIENAREQLNWRHYVAGHPWIALGAAATLGYFLVPARCKCASTAGRPETQGVETPYQPHPTPAASHASNSALNGAIASVVAMLATVAAREGLAAVTKIASQWWEANRDSFTAGQQGSESQRPTGGSSSEAQS